MRPRKTPSWLAAKPSPGRIKPSREVVRGLFAIGWNGNERELPSFCPDSRRSRALHEMLMGAKSHPTPCGTPSFGQLHKRIAVAKPVLRLKLKLAPVELYYSDSDYMLAD